MADVVDDQHINLPSLVAILVISGIVLRYFFFSPSSAPGAAGSSSSSAAGGRQRDGPQARAAREAAAERIQQMFPQVDRRTALWDLQRTGGNVAATAERVLAGRLETPPITFQPPPPPGAANNSAGAGSAGAQQQSKPAPGPVHPDLITRYNLQDKLNAATAGGEQSETGGTGSSTGVAEDTGAAAAAAVTGKGKAWSASRDERQTLLQKRRDQMILEARRKMEAKIAAEKAAAGGS